MMTMASITSSELADLSTLPLIIFVPGLRPKPEPVTHREQLLRCLHEGVARIDAASAADMQSNPDSFELIAWTFPFYGEHQDIEADCPGIEAALKASGATAVDRAKANSFRLRLLRQLYLLADQLPFDVPPLGNEKLEIHLRDLRRYVRNQDGVADETRAMLMSPLQQAAKAGRPTLLVGHSMGCVISYDTLWQLSHNSDEPFSLDTFLTLGSPLGQKLVRRQLPGHDQQGSRRYPNCIQNWTNISATGDLTAIEMNVNDHYHEMVELGLTRRMENHSTYNWFRNHGTDGELNIHSEYGYLINDDTARVIANWWAEKRLIPQDSSAGNG